MNRNMGVPSGFSIGFNADASAGAVAEPGGGTGAPSGGDSPAPQPGAGAPTPASPSGASAGASQPRTYRDEDVQRIVRERLAEEQKKYAPYKEFGDPESVKARLEKADRYEKALRGDEPKGPSPEEKELRELLTKQFPGIDKVQTLEAKLQAMEQASLNAHTKAGRGEIARLAQEKLGTNDKNVLGMLENVVAAAIAGDKESLDAWNSGDVSVISKHFDAVLTNSFDPLFKSASSRYSGGKAKDKAEVPPMMPKGGVQAPASTERKLTGEERRDAAWQRLQQLEGKA